MCPTLSGGEEPNKAPIVQVLFQLCTSLQNKEEILGFADANVASRDGSQLSTLYSN